MHPLRLRFGLWPAVLAIALLALPAVRAQAPAAEPDWYQTLPPSQPGFPQALSGSFLASGSSPTLVDLDGNGTLEIVLGGRGRNGTSPSCGGVVYAYRHDGSLFWQAQVRAPVNSTPTAADLNGDGRPDIIAGMGGVVEGQCWDGGLVALNGLTGAELWHFDTQDWLNHDPDGMLDGVFSTPAVGDVNGDGNPEIAFGSWDQCFYLLDKHGAPLWGNLPGILPQVYCGGHGYYNEDTFWSSPAMADLTGDGLPEIITGADVYPGNVWGDPGGGYVYVFSANGTALAREWLDQDVYSSPAAADLDLDGAFELVVGTGLYWEGTGYYVTAYEYNAAATNPTNRLVQRWRTTTVGPVFASPAIGDLDGDGGPDVAIAVAKGQTPNIDGSFAYGLRGHDGAVLWQRRACDMWGNSFDTQSSAIIADIDGDDRSEVLFSHSWEVLILNHDGTYYTDYSNPLGGSPRHSGCQRTHQPTTDLSYWGEYTLSATPSVGDLDGDGDTEIIVGGHNPDSPAQGMLFAWTGHPAEDQPSWPTFHHNERHTGVYVYDAYPPTNPTSLSSPSHTPAAWSTDNTVQVIWSGAADQGSGLAGYSVVWDRAAATLPDKTIDLPADAAAATGPALADGKAHYFHLRTADNAGNWTSTAVHLGPFWIDAHPPASAAWSPPFATGAFDVGWGGADAASGLRDYTVQVKQDGGAWTTWLENTTAASAAYSGAAGHTYRFRSIARDHAGNVETAYTAAGDTATLVARYLLTGAVYDPRGRPVSGAAVTTQPAALNQPLSGADGGYTLGLLDDAAYAVTAAAPGYGALPARQLDVDASLAGIDFYLPPQLDLVANGGFETSGGWTLDGPVPPSRVAGQGFTGAYALRLGERQESLASAWSAAQSFAVPAAGGAVLAWNYRVDGTPGSGDHLTVLVDGPASDLNRELSLTAAGWTHGWLPLADFAGQDITIRFELSRDSTTTGLLVYLDDIAAGPVPYHIYIPTLFRRS